MTYYGGKELGASFRTVRNNTIKIAEEIPESKYDFRAAPDTRTVAHTLAHIAVGTGFQSYVHTHTIDDLAKALTEKNNGLYTNEWLLGDANTNEIAVLELGTHAHRLRRSSKGEWLVPGVVV